VVEAGAVVWTLVELVERAEVSAEPAGARVPVDGGEVDAVLDPELQAVATNTKATSTAAADGRGPGTRPR
jgi:hypothetical protein